MCVITDENNIVVSISFIPGIDTLPEGYHVYFPVTGELPSMGTEYIPE